MNELEIYKATKAAAEKLEAVYFEADGEALEAALKTASDAADEAVEAAKVALAESDCPRPFELREEGDWYETVDATSVEDALAHARAGVDADNYGEFDSTIWIDVAVRCEFTDEEGSATVRLDPEEPECLDGCDHFWHTVPGSLRGHGGGVRYSEACEICGLGKHVDTWAQRPDTGEQGFHSIGYEAELIEPNPSAQYRVAVDGAGCSDAVDAAAWIFRCIREGDFDAAPERIKHASRINEVVDYLERVYGAVPSEKKDRALRLALRGAADTQAEQTIAETIIRACWPELAQKAAA